MTAFSPRFSSDRYQRHTLRRAERALSCSPFSWRLFQAMQQESVGIAQIVGQRGVQSGYSRRPVAELGAEDALLWLIQVGVLRREVDGQGLTDRFRLTPLGHVLVQRYQDHGRFPQATWIDRLYNAWQRWVRLPF